MEDKLLLELALKISADLFEKEFDGKVRVTEKLLPLRNYGEFVPESNTIYIASQLYVKAPEFAEKVLKHELCHWYAVSEGIAPHDGIVPFENILRKAKAITNGNYPHADEKTAFKMDVIPMECSKCHKPQFDRLEMSRDILLESHCCKADLVEGKPFAHSYKYYEYVR